MSEQFNPDAWAAPQGSSGGGGKSITWFSLEDGQSADVRILDANPFSAWVHRIPTKDGKRHPTVCLGKKDECPACQAGNRAASRHVFNVIDRRDKSPTGRVMELNYKTFQLLTVVVSKMGNPMEYDITISRIGKGKESQYPIFPGARTPLTDAEKQIQTVDFGTYYAKNRERMELLLRGDVPKRTEESGVVAPSNMG